MKKIFLSILTFIALFLFLSVNAQAQAYITPNPKHCNYYFEEGQTPEYDYEYLGSKRILEFEPGEYYEVVIYIKNTGNVPFFSAHSDCNFRAATRLGTTRELDRNSSFYAEPINQPTGWLAPNRIELDQKRVDPGDRGSFTFTIKTPEEEGVYREHFDIVIEGKKWLENDFAMNFDIGEFIRENREYLNHIDKSVHLTKSDLIKEKSTEVSISEQIMRLKIGDVTIKKFPVSTGTWRTPTPYGHTRVLHKQEVRIGSAWPYYIMPKWVAFRHGGYGIHALPSISFDNGYYWREALNHIGQRRSHGCIRLLPDDADFYYEFAHIGMPVWVYH